MAAIHLASTTVPDQERQVAAVVDVRMGQDERVERARIKREWGPVAQAQLLVALEQAAVDEHAACARSDEMFRAGHRAGGAKKCEVHSASAGASPRWVWINVSLDDQTVARLIHVKAGRSGQLSMEPMRGHG